MRKGELGMAGNHRSRTLVSFLGTNQIKLGMAGNHRSRTLCAICLFHYAGWGWPGITAHVHWQKWRETHNCAGDGRESPLTYT